jgi:hypothetical protein
MIHISILVNIQGKLNEHTKRDTDMSCLLWHYLKELRYEIS